MTWPRPGTKAESSPAHPARFNPDAAGRGAPYQLWISMRSHNTIMAPHTPDGRRTDIQCGEINIQKTTPASAGKSRNQKSPPTHRRAASSPSPGIRNDSINASPRTIDVDGQAGAFMGTRGARTIMEAAAVLNN
jgi:hypothetical protein